MGKIYAIIDAKGRPIILGLTGGKIADFFRAAGSLLVQKKAGTLLPTTSTIPMAIQMTTTDRTRAKYRSRFHSMYRQRNLVERF